MKKKIFGLLVALAMAVPSFASITVAPTKLEINANKIKNNYYTTAIDIKGDSQKPMRFKAYTGYFEVSEQGKVIMIDEANGNPYDISNKIRFVPSEFTVAQGKSQKLRINISGLNSLPDGESRALLYIEDVNPKEQNIPTGQSGIGAQLIVKTRVAVPIYIDKGKVKKSAEIESLSVEKGADGLYTVMKISSKGNTKIRYTGNAQIISDKKLVDEYILTGAVVPQGKTYVAKDKIKLDKLSAGTYTIRTVISYIDENGKKQNVKKETILNIQGKV